MEIVSILVSFNKISLLAFVVTFGFILYEFYLLKQEAIKKSKPNIPAFKANLDTKQNNIDLNKVVVVQENKQFFNKPSRKPLYFGLFLLVIFGIIFLIGLFAPQINQNKINNATITPIINFVASKGIKIYNKEWRELTDQEQGQLKPGDSILIGVDILKDMNIDIARIRINSDQWQQDSVTIKLNKEANVIYREYTISTGESSLKIEAQLHSKTDGWLGD